MITNDDVIKACISYKPTKYDKEKHIGIMIDVFSNGEGVAAFLDEASVCKQTFYNWLKAHQEFAKAYEKAINRSQRKWEDYPKNNPDFNFPYWSTIMRNRFGYGKTKVRVVKDATPIARMNAIWEGLEEGELSAQEATQLSSVARTQAEILGNQSLELEPLKQYTQEEKEAQIKEMQKIIDYAERNKHES
jgi:hypothetical protein